MNEKELLAQISAHVNARIDALKVGGIFQRKPLNELMAIKELISGNPITAKEAEILRAPPEGSADIPDPKVRAREIYEAQKKAGLNPEHYEGEDNPGGGSPRPCHKKKKRAE